MTINQKTLRGFTLVEMMVSITLFVIVIGLAYQTMLAATRIRQATSARLEIFQTGRSVIDIMVQELQACQSNPADTTFRQFETAYDALDNGRARFQLVNWPPPKSEAARYGLSPDDTRIYMGNAIDDDGDGVTDEEAYDGLDNDGDGETDSPIDPLTGWAMADGLDNNGDGQIDEGIDEDIFYPRDMVNFVTADLDSSEDIEVGYAIDTQTGRDLLRRTARKSPASPSNIRVDGIYPVATKYLMEDFQNLPAPPPPGSVPTPLYAPWFDLSNPEQGNLPGSVDFQFNDPSWDLYAPPQDLVVQSVDFFALNILGFDMKAYYFDWAIQDEMERLTFSAQTGLSFAPALDFQLTEPIPNYSPYSFPRQSWDSSVEQSFNLPYTLNPIIPLFPNHKGDLAAIPNTKPYLEINQGGVTPETLQRCRSEALQQTDGLPLLVEITLFVQDQNRYREDPIKITTRAYLPQQ